MLRSLCGVALVGAMVCVTPALGSAQSTATSTQTKNFEVLAVNGNTLAVRLPEGPRELNVPDDFRFTVNGQQMSVHQLQPGMKGTATITTKTTMTPVTVTEVKNGQVAMTAGTSVYVRTGGDVKLFNQQELDKRGIKITVDGKPRAVNELHVGDQITAVIVTAQPPRVVTEREVQATLAKAAPAAAAGGAPAPAPTPQLASAAPQGSAAPPNQVARALPKTASSSPAIALAGFASLAFAIALGIRRRRAAR
jgi:LPXTG-motif cell wall-anchored protein